MITTLILSTLISMPLDKVAHSVGSYGLTHATQAVCNRVTNGEHKTGCLISGIMVSATLGAAKEVMDQKRGTNTVKQSLEDGAADAIGIGAAVFFIKIDF